MAEAVTKSWFVVFNNPKDYGYKGKPHDVCERLKNEWCCTDTRSGAWAYCIKHYEGHYPVYDEDGKFLRYAHAETEEEKAKIPPDLHHIHMVLEDTVAMRFSVIKKTYAIGSHFEGTKGNKKEALDYISKSGQYDEKPNKEAGLPWEEIIYSCQKGEIQGAQGKRNDLENIECMLKDGFKPNEILRQKLSYRSHENLIRKAYYDMRDQSTPDVREVKVIWHYGESGSGKSYSRLALNAEVGKDNVYYLTDYQNGGFDKYNGEPYLWLEDYKGEFKFGDFIRYLDVYKADLHCRYSNAKALWTEVHITSIYHPRGAYCKMVQEWERKFDTEDQLLRRISCIRYHYREGLNFKHKDFSVYTTIDEMKKSVRYNPYVPSRFDFDDMESDESFN